MLYLDLQLESSGFDGTPEDRVYLCPVPQHVEFLNEWFKLPREPEIIVSAPELEVLVTQLNEELSIYGWASLNHVPGPESIPRSIEKLWDGREISNKEGYMLQTINGETGTRLIVIAGYPAGMFNGLQTLYQLLVPDSETKGDASEIYLPGVDISDWPSMDIRGLTDDISRGQSPSIDATKRYLKFLARFGMKNYLFYTEDMFFIPEHPKMTRMIDGVDRGPLTRESIRELEEFSARTCLSAVEVSTVYQNLSHMENVLLHDEYTELAEFPGSSCLNLDDPKIYDFISDTLGYVADSFKSPMIHIGCDESWDVGMYKTKQLVAEKGIFKVHLDHYLWVIDFLKKRGKDSILLYHDIVSKYPEALEQLPKEGLILVYWEYSIKDPYPKLDNVLKSGIPYVMSSSCLCWTKPFPDWKNALSSNKHLIETGLAKGAIGQLNSSWGDQGEENLRENNLLPWAYSSALSWNEKGFSDATFQKAFCRAMFGVIDDRWLELFSILEGITSQFSRFDQQHYLGWLWRHPYRSRYPPEIISDLIEEEKLDETEEISEQLWEREDWNAAILPSCERIIELSRELTPAVRRNEYYLAYTEYAGRHIRYLVNKVQTSAKVTQLCFKQEDGWQEKAIALITPILSEIKDQRERYEKLWLKNAGRANLDRILRFYDWQIYWQEQKISQIRNGVSWENPYVESAWICFDETKMHQDPRFFRKTFELTGEKLSQVEAAWIEVMPGNHAIVWVNGKEIGQAKANYAQGAPVLSHRCEYWGIDNLRAGKNVIAVKNTNFMKGRPILNVYIEVHMKDGTVKKIISDGTWKATDELVDGWQDVGYDSNSWSNCKVLGVPPKIMGEISKPRFKLGWKSKISHHNYMGKIRGETIFTEAPDEFHDAMRYFNGEIM
ncbi:MAG: glycoside hydrolase family 20 zincin-like fold domain-containing protein [Promethearchaeota archaeon]